MGKNVPLVSVIASHNNSKSCSHFIFFVVPLCSSRIVYIVGKLLGLVFCFAMCSCIVYIRSFFINTSFYYHSNINIIYKPFETPYKTKKKPQEQPPRHKKKNYLLKTTSGLFKASTSLALGPTFTLVIPLRTSPSASL